MHRNAFELTLVDVAFVLPMCLARNDKRMMTNYLLNRHLVFYLVNAIVEDYLQKFYGDEIRLECGTSLN